MNEFKLIVRATEGAVLNIYFEVLLLKCKTALSFKRSTPNAMTLVSQSSDQLDLLTEPDVLSPI